MKKHYKIGEISELYDIGKDSLMYYEKLGLISPKRDNNGYRLYESDDMWKLNLIRELRHFDIPMKRIKEYFNLRTIKTTTDILKEEKMLINRKIEELIQNKNNIEMRLKSIEDSAYDKNLNNINLVHCKMRKAIMEKIDMSSEGDTEYVLKQIQKEHEDKVYILGNSNMGVMYDTNLILEAGEFKYKSAFYLIKNCKRDCNMVLEEGDYLTLSYNGGFNEDKPYLEKMLSYIEEKNYKINGEILKICKINIHETSKLEEQVTEIQIPVIKN